MNHLKRKSLERMISNFARIEVEALDLRKQANKLPKRFWQKRRALRAEANEKMQMVRTGHRLAERETWTN